MFVAAGELMADGEVLAVTALVAVFGLAIAIVKLYFDLNSEKRRSEVDSKRLGLDVKQVSEIQRIARSHDKQVEQVQKLVESLAKVVASYESELSSMRREVEKLRRTSGTTVATEGALVEIEKQKLAQRQREAEWRKTRDFAKGLGWLLGRMSSNDDEDDEG